MYQKFLNSQLNYIFNRKNKSASPASPSLCSGFRYAHSSAPLRNASGALHSATGMCKKKDCPSNITKKAVLFKNSPSQNPRKTLFIAPLLKNQRSVDSCKCKIVAHNILCIHLATFTTNVVQIATFRVNVIKIKCWMEPAYNRRTVKNERASVYLGSSIPRLRARFIERVKILAKLYLSLHFLKIKEVLIPANAKLLLITYSASILRPSPRM